MEKERVRYCKTNLNLKYKENREEKMIEKIK